ncbi:MAG: PTS sugar transporter [Deltaproteobacteria bacterium]|nr:PTS sugar transporter [Deltaproteobacteria bacterium]MBW1921425.1 PTS sugar transporter [Deltaproteobacteria bacterium]MBW1935996.1 PTS sugar transporter [Deltaproteobacteria bacterium]MBW1977204.1 PTS sugar transporter [Deltaproteobacteria bacterium]MBW2045448.1 PTS sugar transporter [Deltaproteobacteria bacterium]
MIGLLIVTHCDLGGELLNAAQFIVGKIDNADTVPITETTGSEKIRKVIEERVNALNTGDGVIILTDMFGGTPSNLSLSFLKKEKVEVLTGVNLPMIIAIIQNRPNLKLDAVAEKAQEAGKNGISLASKLLESS